MCLDRFGWPVGEEATLAAYVLYLFYSLSKAGFFFQRGFSQAEMRRIAYYTVSLMSDDHFAFYGLPLSLTSGNETETDTQCRL